MLIDGARRVGKSYIVEEFAKNEYESYILIDFNNTMQQVLDLFRDYLYDLDTFFMYLQLYFNVKLTARKSLIIFDEVQAFPEARAAIKYLVKDGRYDYIETGSLVSINKNVKNIMIPSEEIRINMYPMDFEEFLWAMDEEAIMQLIKISHASIHSRLVKGIQRYTHPLEGLQLIRRKHLLADILPGLAIQRIGILQLALIIITPKAQPNKLAIKRANNIS